MPWLWQHLLAEAERHSLDVDRAAVREWLANLLGLDGKEVKRLFLPTISDQDWNTWLQNLKALRGLARSERERTEFGSLDLWAARAAVRGGARAVITARKWEEIGEHAFWIAPTADADKEPHRHFWQAVFISFFCRRVDDPGQRLWLSLCHICGKRLESTPTGKLSRAKLCPSCRVKASRERNPEKTRERWKRDKRRQRGRTGE